MVIAFHIAVIIEMILRQICKPNACKAQSCQSLLIERVRRALHDDIFTAGVRHACEHAMQRERIGRRMLGRQRDVSDLIVNGSDQPGLMASRLQDVFDHIADGRFPIGAGHANQTQTARGIAVPVAADDAVGVMRIAADNLIFQSNGAFTQDGGRAGLCGLYRVIMPVGARAADTDKQRPRLHLPRIGGDAGDFTVPVRAGSVKPVEQFVKAHKDSPFGRVRAPTGARTY